MWKLIRAIWLRWVTHARAVSALATCLKSIYGIVSHSIYRISWPQTCDSTSTSTATMALRVCTDDRFIGLMTSRWRKCVPHVCLCVSHVCPGRVAYREITFIIGTQPAKRNCQIEKRKPKKKYQKTGERTRTKRESVTLLVNLLLESRRVCRYVSICPIWHYINWNGAERVCAVKSIMVIRDVTNSPSIK